MSDTKLIPVAKGADYLEVHPATLADHQRVGWAVCEKREQEDPEGAKKATIAELREALTAKGIEIPEGAKKADLQALLDAANKPADPA
jgi:hypothetical protein